MLIRENTLQITHPNVLPVGNATFAHRPEAAVFTNARMTQLILCGSAVSWDDCPQMCKYNTAAVDSFKWVLPGRVAQSLSAVLILTTNILKPPQSCFKHYLPVAHTDSIHIGDTCRISAPG